MMNEMERHIMQNNDRLQCIKQQLASPAGFQSAARELLEWCSDARAFQRPFENSLIGCLTVVSRVAAQPGFDLELAYRLLAVCAAHRDKFTPKAAAMLSMWCEELGRLLLLRHQKNRTPDSAKSPGMHHQMQKSMPPVPQSDPNAAWSAGSQGGQAQQALSVVTTVWGVTQTTQSGPFTTHNTPSYTNTTMSTTNYTQQPQGFPGGQMQKAAFNQQSIPYRRDSGNYGRPSGYPPTPNTPGSNPPPPMTGNTEYPAPQSALSAALVAAAATATATATATASMVALQEQHNQQQQMNINMNMNQYGAQMQGQQPFNNQYGIPQQRPPGSIAMAQGPGPGGMPTKTMPNMYQRRSAPYPNPQQMLTKRQQYPNGTQYGAPVPYGSQQQHPAAKPQYPPTQQPLPSPTYVGPQQGMRPNGPTPPYSNGQNIYMGPNQFPNRQAQPPGFNQFPSQQNFQQSGMNYQHSPLPGNPTPPMTPGSAVPPYVSPGGDMKPNFSELKPPLHIKKETDELRLTFPVRDGVVLPPFRLEHNLAVSNHAFHLRESVYQTLMWRSDLELQLKCFHHEDRQMNTNWPASVTVSVNATPLNIERGENKTSHKPLYLKDVCQPGRNTIQITVTACCCSHLFVLQLVHRPSVRSVLQGLLRKRLLPAEHCITKIKRNFSNVPSGSNTLNGEDGVEQTAMKVSLKCPITFRRISLPARGHDCKHIQCFDLDSYLQLNCERGSWRCPVCNKTALLEGLEIDQYIWAVLNNLANTDFEEVTIDQTASWKPVPLKTAVKQEEENEPCSGGNTRWVKAMSPSSMSLPTMNSLDMGGHQPSSYSLPPASQATPFSGTYNNDGNGNFQGRPPDFPGQLTHLGENMSGNNMPPTDKQLNHPPGQFGPVPGDQSNQQLRHPEQQSMMNNHMTPSSQPQSMNPSNGSHPLSHQANTPQPSIPNTDSLTHRNLGDLNFDPAAVIDGEGQGQEGLDLLPENIGDPMELLSYLGPSENNRSGDNSAGNMNSGNNSNSGNNNDDLLALFES